MHTCDCGFSCTSKYSLNRHLLSRHHEQNLSFNEHIVASEVSGLFECDLCEFSSAHKGNFKQHLLSAKHRAAKERHTSVQPCVDRKPVQQNSLVSSAVVASMENQVVQPVMLIEVMELFLNHMKHETELFKTFADRIVAHQQQQQPPITVVQTAETMTNTNNNQKFNLNEECENAINMKKIAIDK